MAWSLPNFLAGTFAPVTTLPSEALPPGAVTLPANSMLRAKSENRVDKHEVKAIASGGAEPKRLGLTVSGKKDGGREA
eukprot:CAMPEP_0179039050 /NCGR_PEP_ID=MMETSP0796-20121207/14946_1 /TAXON_ID=73915 /ORGANISM="Pyrodinium bahamense, Strain pbaha01" /LENGTH=77 /DNA_ID=CAMNT_0020735381 /DNA_START=33 /DNA_END=266 /DNA_ORIENTATION=-